MSLLPFWALNMVVPLLSMEGQKTLGFHQNFCSLNEMQSSRSFEQKSIPENVHEGDKTKMD